jgi:hypothetical protein
MATFQPGEIAALVSGSPRMAVEAVDGDAVSLVWCNEGIIYRDTFATVLLKKWEAREGEDRAPRRTFDKSPREGGNRDGGRDGGSRGGPRDSGPPKGKTGWDGKPREKSHFRKD